MERRFLMAGASVLIAGAALTACSPSANDSFNEHSKRGTFMTGGIVNGKVADGTEGWAGTVIGIGTKSPMGGYSIFCSGSLLSDKTIVTAAHCIGAMSSETYIVFGLTENAKDVQGRKILRKMTHEKYEPWFPQDAIDVSDIGLAEFEGGLPVGYHSIEILPDETLLADNAEILLAGYGVTDGRFQVGSGILRSVSVKIRDSKYGKMEVITDELAAGSCNGDSGGPGLIMVEGKYYLWGATSRGDSACSKEGIYTKVVSYKEWINTSVAAWQNQPLPVPTPLPTPSPTPSPAPGE